MRKYLLAASGGGGIYRSGLRGGQRALCRDRRRCDVPQQHRPRRGGEQHGTTTTTYDNGFKAKYKTGYDVDAILGYKFGLFRLEGEAGYKRAKVKSLGVSTPLITDVGTAAGVDCHCRRFQRRQSHRHQVADGERLDRRRFRRRLRRLCRRRRRPRVGEFAGDSDNAWAVQGIAGVRYAISPNVDAGLKYRYFHTGKLGFNDAFTLNAVPFTTSAKGNYDSHSLLASLVYNFNSRGEAVPIPAAAPAPPPPPPPERTGDPDLRGRIGDPGDVGLPGAAATAAASSRARRARTLGIVELGLGSRARSTRVREFACQRVSATAGSCRWGRTASGAVPSPSTSRSPRG